jgi:hypothetical protein
MVICTAAGSFYCYAFHHLVEVQIVALGLPCMDLNGVGHYDVLNLIQTRKWHIIVSNETMRISTCWRIKKFLIENQIVLSLVQRTCNKSLSQ